MHLVSALAKAGRLPSRPLRRLGLMPILASGRNDEVLRYHGLDAASLAEHVSKVL